MARRSLRRHTRQRVSPSASPMTGSSGYPVRRCGSITGALEYWADSTGRRNTPAKEVAMKRYGAVWIDVSGHLWGRQAGLERRCERIVDSSGWRLPRGARARMLRLMPGCRRLSEYGGSGGRAACHQHISRGRQDLRQGATFRSPNVRRSPSCARRVMVCEPSLVSWIALHARSLVNSGAMWRAATALQNTERPRHNGTLIGPPDGQSRRSWRLIRCCEIMYKTGLPV